MLKTHKRNSAALERIWGAISSDGKRDMLHKDFQPFRSSLTNATDQMVISAGLFYRHPKRSSGLAREICVDGAVTSFTGSCNFVYSDR